VPALLLVTGPPGAGKSTVAGILAGRFERSVLITGDSFFHFLARGAVEPWRFEANTQNEVVTRAAAAATGRFVEGGYEVVYDGVVGPWFLPTFLAATGLVELNYAVLLPSLERCARGVVTRRDHGFRDEAATAHMHREFSGAQIDERHVLRDLPDGAELVADLIEERLGTGSLLYR
jgi:cytidylate kinase